MTAATSNFGAYLMQPIDTKLLIMLGNSPGNEDGCQIFNSSDGINFTHEFTPSEQGGNIDGQLLGTDFWMCGQDPTDDWTLGNIYHRNSSGVWTKIRTLPNTIHALGLWHDGSTLWIGGGMHTGDNATWKGRVLRSVDNGATWEAQADVNNYRIYDIIGHSSKLYAVGYDWTGIDYTQDLHVSSDTGNTWSKVSNVTPAIKPRMVAFGTSLLVAGASSNLYRVDVNHAITTYVLPFTMAAQWNTVTTDGTNVYALDSSGYVWRSSNLSSWEAYTFVSGAISIAWMGSNLMISDVGINARIWKA
jgi:hypothetical protein